MGALAHEPMQGDGLVGAPQLPGVMGILFFAEQAHRPASMHALRIKQQARRTGLAVGAWGNICAVSIPRIIVFQFDIAQMAHIQVGGHTGRAAAPINARGMDRASLHDIQRPCDVADFGVCQGHRFVKRAHRQTSWCFKGCLRVGR